MSEDKKPAARETMEQRTKESFEKRGGYGATEPQSALAQPKPSTGAGTKPEPKSGDNES